jgi:RNA polymerase sigma-70 factor, ECF subfamily
MEYSKLSSSNLIDQCIEKDPLAWAEFVKRTSSLLLYSIKKVLREYSPMGLDEEAKDILQNLLLSIWSKNKLSTIRIKDTINYWLATSARNATINHIKSKKKEVLMRDESYFDNILIDTIEEDCKFNKHDIERVKNIYSSLKERDKLLFNLYFHKEVSLKDISNIVKSPIGTVSSAITRIRKKIKCSKY